VMDRSELENEFEKAVSGHAVLGTPDDVIEQLRNYVSKLPVDPILLRPQWPTMSGDETVAAINRLGRDIVPALREMPTRTTIDPSAFETVGEQ
jgi:alkanesulfonate monooxygenase SsuD/methylene tetrahydromethanopterin reductase-like flavin-dependent oxidoreductase (luciferase family)